MKIIALGSSLPIYSINSSLMAPNYHSYLSAHCLSADLCFKIGTSVSINFGSDSTTVLRDKELPQKRKL